MTQSKGTPDARELLGSQGTSQAIVHTEIVTMEILVRILAATDAIFLPLRCFESPLPANTFFARRDFPSMGVYWRSQMAGEVDRKAAQRQMEELVHKGLVTAFRPRKAKVLGVRLTDAAECATRELCGLPGTLEGALLTVQAIERRGAKRKWVSETKLAGLSYGATGAAAEFALVEEIALPALIRGWIESGSDVHGRVSYRLLEAGRRMLRDGPSPDAGNATAPDATLRRLYYDELQAARVQMAETVMKSREIGLMPLPEGSDR